MNETLPFLVYIVVVLLIVWVYRKKFMTEVTLPPVIPQEGISIPITNAYQGTRFFNVHSSLWAVLILFEDHFEFRIITKKSFSFGEVKSIDLNSGFWNGGRSSLNISFNNGAWNYAAYMNKHNLRVVLNYFKTKGCILTEKAEDFLKLP